ncbi:MAG: synthase subunit delta [Crocinitomicaceae bacterium]|jgi:F-type H+-transporting ATPase subunit delta|nr:synthase subunit delta [Crocinitomicaceae bacterium]
MKATKSASRYAKALLELAIEQNKTEVVSRDMRRFTEAFRETREFQLFLDSPVINADKKNAILNEVFPGFDMLTRSFIELLVRKGRENALGQIADSFDAQLKSHLGIIPVTLISAQALDEATKKTILSKLEKSLNGKLELEEKIDPSLIGGFIVKMGDTQIDASVSNKLKNLKVNLTR